MSFYVYELYDPRDDVVFYVGKGKANRIDHHEREARNGRQSRKCAKIREIEAAGQKIGKRKISHHKDECDAFEAEEERINWYGLDSLTNLVLGGGGASTGGPTSYEDRRLVVAATKLFRRTNGRAPANLMVCGQVLDMSFVPKMLDESIYKVAKRRGIDWVNAVAKSYAIKYVIQSEPVAEAA